LIGDVSRAASIAQVARDPNQRRTTTTADGSHQLAALIAIRGELTAGPLDVARPREAAPS
jgi:hypothetical protein